ncbi:MAG TPA: aldo/keto reductase [Xanthomonadaceae bacterium]|jgi:hypothetical protein
MTSTSPASRLALGTAQFGLPYGISNTGGQVSRVKGAALLSLAARSGMDTLDTAIAYGESESRLGKLGVPDWKVITKLPALPDGVGSVAGWVDEHVSGSLSRLRIQRLHGLLLHRPEQLLAADGKALHRALLDQRDRGRVGKIGVSIYGPDELDNLPASMRFDIVQAPLNILDRRMLQSGWARRLSDSGCEFHARSIFLQGLLLMSPAARPARFDRWEPLWRIWDDWLDATGTTALQACLQFAIRIPEVGKVVVGVDSAAHLGGILEAASSDAPPPLPEGFATDDLALLNPALWPRT